MKGVVAVSVAAAAVLVAVAAGPRAATGDCGIPATTPLWIDYAGHDAPIVPKPGMILAVSSGTAVPAQMRAGAAPDARVCWMVGAGGVVLRTTDGATWTRVAFPAADDLVAVQASDASRATVTTAAGLRFATGDGGATWAPQ